MLKEIKKIAFEIVKESIKKTMIPHYGVKRTIDIVKKIKEK